MYHCDILADSMSHQGHRLTSFLVTYPRMIHSEFLTHGMLVRNSESSRARPVKKNIADVDQQPFVPEAFGKNQPGMQFEQMLSHDQDTEARVTWKYAAGDAVAAANALAELDVHKSYANRVLEPYKWHTAIYSGTDWANFFALRAHADAQPEFRRIALMMREAYREHEPRQLGSGQWHIPFVTDDEVDEQARLWPEPFIDWSLWLPVSAGRCARISYLTHDGKRDLEADRELAKNRLQPSGHMSPFGHQARPFSEDEWNIIRDLQEHISVDGTPFDVRLHRNLEYCAQYHGWWQARADIPNEHDFSKVLEVTTA